MKYISLSLPGMGGTPIAGPNDLPVGGLGVGGTGTNAIQVGINFLFVVGVILAIILIAYSGIQWAASGGDKERVQKARRKLTYAIIGLVVAAIAFAIYPVMSLPILIVDLVLLLLLPF